jgi:hypothetical protein
MTKLPIERCIDVVLATFGALAGFALVRFITTAPPNVPNPLQSRPDELNWLIFALAALLLRYMLGSAVHLHRTYVPDTAAPATPGTTERPGTPGIPGTPPLPDWWTIVFFFKDLFFLILYGVVAIKITQSADISEFINRSAIFILWGLVWGVTDFGLRFFKARAESTPMLLANYRIEMNWIVLDAVQYILALLILQTKSAEILTLVFLLFLFLDVVVLMGHSVIPDKWMRVFWSKAFPSSIKAPPSGDNPHTE